MSIDEQRSDTKPEGTLLLLVRTFGPLLGMCIIALSMVYWLVSKPDDIGGLLSAIYFALLGMGGVAWCASLPKPRK
jgi:hypothetical protein